MSAKISTEKFIAKSKLKYPNKFTYDSTVYTHSHDPITVTCNIHGDQVFARPNIHFSSSGCKQCSYKNKEIVKKLYFQERYGENVTCSMHVKENLDKYNSTCLKNLGVTNPFKSELIQKKCYDTILRNNGGIHTFSTPEFSIYSKRLNLERYGVEYYSQTLEWRSKVIATSLNKYGIPWASNLPEFRDKMVISLKATWDLNKDSILEQRKNTCLNRYGVEHLIQLPEFFEKVKLSFSKYFTSNKYYKFLSGNTYLVQGYEPLAIDLLLAKGYLETDLILKNRPSIKYFWSYLDGYGDNKWHCYHPDIFILKDNKIIEVKSKYFFDKTPLVLAQNIAKRKGCEAQGLNHEFWIFDKGELSIR